MRLLPKLNLQITHRPAGPSVREAGPDDVPDEYDNGRRGGGPDDSSDPDFGDNGRGDYYDGPDGRYDYDPYY